MLALVAGDLFAHKRVETLGGLNIRGYRGPVARQRQQNELRIVFAGGTRAFGWGEPASGTIPAAVRFELTRVLDRPNEPLRPIVVINLGQIGARPESYPSTFERYASLQPDYAGIIDDLGEAGPNRPFDASGIFAITGYRPMLPLVLYEKGTVTKRRTLGVPLEYVGSTLAAIDRGLARATAGRDVEDADAASATSPEAYATAMMAAIEAAHRHARGVVVALAPIDTEAQRRNSDALTARLAAAATPPWLRIVDLGKQADLHDPELRLDAFSFGAAATGRAAQAIAPAFLDLPGVRAGNVASR